MKFLKIFYFSRSLPVRERIDNVNSHCLCVSFFAREKKITDRAQIDVIFGASSRLRHRRIAICHVAIVILIIGALYTVYCTL